MMEKDGASERIAEMLRNVKVADIGGEWLIPSGITTVNDRIYRI